MALDPVPFVIGGDAEHGPDVFRQALYLATGGKQGVGSPGDLKVTALDVPGAGVRIASGAGTILNRVASQQSYGVRNPTADLESIRVPASGSAGGRSHLVICRVDNPYVDGNAQAPADPVHGPYDKFDIISDVPAGTRRIRDLDQYKGLSAIELARIDLPASTGTVTAATITDLRTLATPRTEQVRVSATPTDYYVTMATGQWKPFPEKPITGLQVPEWATHAIIRLETAMKYLEGNAYGNFRGFIGPAGAQATANLFATQGIDATTVGGQYRQPFIAPSSDYFPIPASMRGTTVQLTGLVQPNSAPNNGARIGTAAGDYYFADVTFIERIS
jgi:hypothetical protein